MNRPLIPKPIVVVNNDDSFSARDRIVAIAAGFIAADPSLTRSAALARAMLDFPELAAAAS
jgi:hypothetical protein